MCQKLGSRSNFKDTDLAGTDLSFSDMNGAIFEPRSMPQTRGIATSISLEKLTFNQNPDGLAQLRKQFQDGGFITQERKLTYALRHTRSQQKHVEALYVSSACLPLRKLFSKEDRRQLEVAHGSDPYKHAPCAFGEATFDWLDYWFDHLAFDWTCRYGMEPNRCWKLFGVVLSFATIIYFAFMHLPGDFTSGIYRVVRNTNKQGVQQEVQQRITYYKLDADGRWRYFRYGWQLLKGEGRFLYYGLFFSLMSAFNIGFRDINFGRWLRLLTVREYDLSPRGWVRPIAGLQALFSVAMVALWVLTYFGRPFSQ